MSRMILLTALLGFTVGLSGCATLAQDEALPDVAGDMPEVQHNCELWESWDNEAGWCY